MKCSYCGATEGFSYVSRELEGYEGYKFQLECGNCNKKVDSKGQEEEVAAAKQYCIDAMRKRRGND